MKYYKETRSINFRSRVTVEQLLCHVTVSVCQTMATTTTTTKSTLKHRHFSYIHLHPKIISPTKRKQKLNFDLLSEELNNPEQKGNNFEQKQWKRKRIFTFETKTKKIQTDSELRSRKKRKRIIECLLLAGQRPQQTTTIITE
jgi:hypothetical protein